MSARRHADYLVEIFTPEKIVDAFKMAIPTSYSKNKGIVYVGTGLSGTAALFILKAAGLIERLAIVRKGCTSHSSFHVECSHDFDHYTCRWIFIDDMIDTGDTFKRVLDRFSGKRFVGALMYHAYPTWRSPGNEKLKRFLEEVS